ncbi:MAG: hypothetical protein PGN07_04655 [Aeromicrobium erythreum]
MRPFAIVASAGTTILAATCDHQALASTFTAIGFGLVQFAGYALVAVGLLVGAGLVVVVGGGRR